MQRVSGLFGNGVLQEDPTDRAAAANQRAALDVWGAQQGNEWGKEARAQMMEQARQEAMQRLAAQREQMGLQADLTREGWGREDARSKSQFDYYGNRDKMMLAAEDARAQREHGWKIEDPTYQANAALVGYSLASAKAEAAQRAKRQEIIDRLGADPNLVNDPTFRNQARIYGVDAGGFADPTTQVKLAVEAKKQQAAVDPSIQTNAAQRIKKAVEAQMSAGLKVADNEWGSPSEQAIGKARMAEKATEDAVTAIADETGIPRDQALAIAREHMKAYTNANAPKRFWGGRDELINALIGPALNKPY